MKWIKSFAYAWNGLKICFVHELNFRIHVIFMIIVVLLASLFKISALEWIAIGLSISFVITMEMFNTAIERLCDIVHVELHPGIKKIKDIAAAAVLIAALFSLLTGTIIFLPKLIFYFTS